MEEKKIKIKYNQGNITLYPFINFRLTLGLKKPTVKMIWLGQDDLLVTVTGFGVLITLQTHFLEWHVCTMVGLTH